MKIITIIGARPQIIKAAALSRAISGQFAGKISEIIVHTGQHYDQAMSQVFFTELNIPEPHYNLQAGSGTHGRQTGAMISGIEEILEKEKPDAIVLYGDTNSTIAGALAASKIFVPVVHIEAGLRSFNKKMPEEINRILCDHVSTLLFSPTRAGIKNLQAEGFKMNTTPPFHINNPGVFHCGDIMYDNSLHFSAQADPTGEWLASAGLKPDNFILATIHRDTNTDDAERLSSIFRAMVRIKKQTGLAIYLPLHPRARKNLPLRLSPALLKEAEEHVIMAEPASFLEMIALESNARLVLSDSGGVQKEAYFFKRPCVVLRDQTEWTELVENGNNLLAGADEEAIVKASETLLNKTDYTFPPVFGDGNAAGFICETMLKYLS